MEGGTRAGGAACPATGMDDLLRMRTCRTGPITDLALAQLRNLQPVRLGPVLDRLLAARQRLGDRLQRHPLAGEQMQLLNLVLPPGLPVPLELFRHLNPPNEKGPRTATLLPYS